MESHVTAKTRGIDGLEITEVPENVSPPQAGGGVVAGKLPFGNGPGVVADGQLSRSQQCAQVQQHSGLYQKVWPAGL